MTGDQIQTFMMLLMYTGLRISDAATFSTDKLQENNAFLFMHKTDEPVFTWIPDELVARLRETPLYRGKYYFIGPITERKETAADLWRRKLNDVFDMAGPWKIRPTPHPATLLHGYGSSAAFPSMMSPRLWATVIRRSR